MKSFYTNVDIYGSQILYRGYNQTGHPITKKVKFSPTLFFPSREPSDWTALDGSDVVPKQFETIRDAKEAFERYDGVENFTVHGNSNFTCQYIQENFPGHIEWDYKTIKVGNFDIEVDSGEDGGFPHPDKAEFPVVSITYKDMHSNITHVWGLKDYDRSKDTVNEGIIQYRKCHSEEELLAQFLTFWVNNCPDVITGWYINGFDIPYIINRITRLAGEKVAKRLSPWNLVYPRSYRNKTGQEIKTFTIKGIQTLDFIEVFEKFGYVYGKMESHTLNHVSSVILGEKKLSYDEYGSLANLYQENHQRYIEYNIRDVHLVEKLEQKTGLLEQAITVAYKGGVNYADALGTTGIWDSIIYRYLHDRKVAIPPMVKKHKKDYPGGYVKEPVPAAYDWVTSFDLNSLYPMTIVQYNMSPETIVDGRIATPNGVDYFVNNSPSQDELDLNYAIAANGVMFRKDKQGAIPEIIEAFYAERKTIKKKMILLKQQAEGDKTKDISREVNILDNQQQSIKILMNSLYGALANEYFRYFDVRIAEGITLSGQLAAKWAERELNKWVNGVLKTDKDYVIAMDTDSCYIELKDLVDTYCTIDPVKFIDTVCEEKIVPAIEAGYDRLFKHLNAYTPKMVMAREAIASRGVWTGKKRYILYVHNNEGVQYAKPKLKVVGLESVKSSTPQPVRDKMKESFEVIMTGGEEDLQKLVEDFREEFRVLPVEDVSWPRGVSNVSKWRDANGYGKSGTPIHVRGALNYNRRVIECGLEKKETLITDGGKIKFCYLILPNPLRENVISYPIFLNPDLGLQKFIDYDKQFDKAFLQPLTAITDAIGWKAEKVDSLEDFF